MRDMAAVAPPARLLTRKYTAQSAGQRHPIPGTAQTLPPAAATSPIGPWILLVFYSLYPLTFSQQPKEARTGVPSQ
jgi:hypothetical protein